MVGKRRRTGTCAGVSSFFDIEAEESDESFEDNEELWDDDEDLGERSRSSEFHVQYLTYSAERSIHR